MDLDKFANQESSITEKEIANSNVRNNPESSCNDALLPRHPKGGAIMENIDIICPVAEIKNTCFPTEDGVPSTVSMLSDSNAVVLCDNEDLVDSNNDSVQSTSSQKGLLASAARKYAKDKVMNDEIKAAQKGILKNLIVLCSGINLTYCAFFSIRNLQSSLIPDSGLGLFSLSLIYASFVIMCVFASPIIEKVGQKNTLIVALVGIMVYVGCNLYPKNYILLPASVILGSTLPLLWISHGSYLTNLAREYANWSGKSTANSISRFTGIFFMFWHIAGMIGNLVSSLILYSGNSLSDIERNETDWLNATEAKDSNEHYNYLLVQNSSRIDFTVLMSENQSDVQVSLAAEENFMHLCGANFCHYSIIEQPTTMSTTPITVQILMGAYLVCCVAGIFVIGKFLKKDKRSDKPTRPICQQFAGVFKHLQDRRALLLVSLILYCGVEQAFLFGEMTKAFVSCPYGVHKVGYVMICFGTFDALSSLLSGQLQKYIGRVTLVITESQENLR